MVHMHAGEHFFCGVEAATKTASAVLVQRAALLPEKFQHVGGLVN
jgi:hypothetical protein